MAKLYFMAQSLDDEHVNKIKMKMKLLDFNSAIEPKISQHIFEP